MSLMSKLKKNSTSNLSETLTDQKILNTSRTALNVPIMNLALSGKLDGGLDAGLTVIAGPSKHFKTSFALCMCADFLKSDPEAVMLFIDTEFGSKQAYFEQFDIDTDRVLHVPVRNIEEMKFELVSQLENIERKDKVIIMVDSVGNSASKKELDDALDEKSVADMTRAKALKGLFRMVTPDLTLKDIPMIVINHTYKEQGLFPKDIVSGGCVVKGTKIQTPTGLKEVQDFNVGEKVITLNGEKQVSHVWNPDTLEEGNPECYEIEFEDGYVVTCSADHKFIIDGQWVAAKDIVAGMDCEVI